MLDHIEHAAQFNVDNLQILGKGISKITCNLKKNIPRKIRLGRNNQEIFSLQFLVYLLENSADDIRTVLSLCLFFWNQFLLTDIKFS